MYANPLYPKAAYLFLCVFDESDCITNSSDFFSSLIGNLDVKFLFEFHDQLYSVQRVGAEIVSEAGFHSNFFFINTKLINNNSLNFRSNFRHVYFNFLSLTRCKETKKNSYNHNFL